MGVYRPLQIPNPMMHLYRALGVVALGVVALGVVALGMVALESFEC